MSYDTYYETPHVMTHKLHLICYKYVTNHSLNPTGVPPPVRTPPVCPNNDFIGDGHGDGGGNDDNSEVPYDSDDDEDNDFDHSSFGFYE